MQPFGDPDAAGVDADQGRLRRDVRAHGWRPVGVQSRAASGRCGLACSNQSCRMCGRPRRRSGPCAVFQSKAGFDAARSASAEVRRSSISVTGRPKRPCSWWAKRRQRAVISCSVPSSDSGRPTTQPRRLPFGDEPGDGGEARVVGVGVDGGQGIARRAWPRHADALQPKSKPMPLRWPKSKAMTVKPSRHSTPVPRGISGMPATSEVGEIEAEQLHRRRQAFFRRQVEEDAAASAAR